jgi:hypothetical protein
MPPLTLADFPVLLLPLPDEKALNTPQAASKEPELCAIHPKTG